MEKIFYLCILRDHFDGWLDIPAAIKHVKMLPEFNGPGMYYSQPGISTNFQTVPPFVNQQKNHIYPVQQMSQPVMMDTNNYYHLPSHKPTEPTKNIQQRNNNQTLYRMSYTSDEEYNKDVNEQQNKNQWQKVKVLNRRKVNVSSENQTSTIPNFSKTEENLLVQLVSKYAKEVECKRSDTDTNKIKKEALESIEQEFNSLVNSQFRDAVSLRK
ncbi:hypothetical protein FQA39_LY09575 [Lamprigera yunnana]|nr:hypothetical protein FQA39_LY09575 [Lamprigera yunnana]